jgi:hypothetical protein
MSVKCGNKRVHPDGAYHGSVDEVRFCFMGVLPNIREVVQVSVSHQAQAGGVAVLERPQAPVAPAPVRQAQEIPVGGRGKGYFALPGGDGTLHFFQVSRPQDGKYKGFTFLSEQASDEFFPVKGARKASILADIAQDPQAAGKAYADEIGNCYKCNRTLTDEVSRSLGVGPTCAARS